MSVHDEIFPQHQDLAFVQTQWSKDWHGISGGFEYAARYLTENRSKFGATIDQVGLAIFFMQRHRVEIALKAMLNGLKAEVPGHHSLRRLWRDVEAAARPRSEKDWKGFARDHADLIDALDAVDSQSFAFRYPVKKDGTPVDRPPYIDLDALERHVSEFDRHASAYVDYITEDWS